jgi:hypothetical protein
VSLSQIRQQRSEFAGHQEMHSSAAWSAAITSAQSLSIHVEDPLHQGAPA